MRKGSGMFFVYRRFCGRTTRNGKRAKAGYHRVSKAVLAHRLLLNGKARMSHTTEEEVVEEIVGKIQVPKL